MIGPTDASGTSSVLEQQQAPRAAARPTSARRPKALPRLGSSGGSTGLGVSGGSAGSRPGSRAGSRCSTPRGQVPDVASEDEFDLQQQPTQDLPAVAGQGGGPPGLLTGLGVEENAGHRADPALRNALDKLDEVRRSRPVMEDFSLDHFLDRPSPGDGRVEPIAEAQQASGGFSTDMLFAALGSGASGMASSASGGMVRRGPRRSAGVDGPWASASADIDFSLGGFGGLASGLSFAESSRSTSPGSTQLSSFSSGSMASSGPREQGPGPRPRPAAERPPGFADALGSPVGVTPVAPGDPPPQRRQGRPGPSAMHSARARRLEAAGESAASSAAASLAMYSAR